MSLVGENTGILTQAQQQNSTGEVDKLHIEEYGGKVERVIYEESLMRGYTSVQRVQGTDTVTNDRMGQGVLQAVVKGKRPEGAQIDFDAISLKVDTMILARNNVHHIDTFQNRYDTRMEIGQDHGELLSEFYDEVFIIQAIKATSIEDGVYKGGQTGPGVGEGTNDLPTGWKGGTRITLDNAGDEGDPDKLERAIEDMITNIKKNKVSPSKIAQGMLLVAPDEYATLMRNDKLIDSTFSMGNGNYGQGKVLASMGVRIVETNLIPQEKIDDHLLSNDKNNNAYDITSAEAKAKVIYCHPKSFLAGETVPLTSKVYYHDPELQWFIDSYMMFGVTTNRGEYSGAVFAA